MCVLPPRYIDDPDLILYLLHLWCRAVLNVTSDLPDPASAEDLEELKRIVRLGPQIILELGRRLEGVPAEPFPVPWDPVLESTFSVPAHTPIADSAFSENIPSSSK